MSSAKYSNDVWVVKHGDVAVSAEGEFVRGRTASLYVPLFSGTPKRWDESFVVLSEESSRRVSYYPTGQNGAASKYSEVKWSLVLADDGNILRLAQICHDNNVRYSECYKQIWDDIGSPAFSASLAVCDVDWRLVDSENAMAWKCLEDTFLDATGGSMRLQFKKYSKDYLGTEILFYKTYPVTEVVVSEDSDFVLSGELVYEKFGWMVNFGNKDGVAKLEKSCSEVGLSGDMCADRIWKTVGHSAFMSVMEAECEIRDERASESISENFRRECLKSTFLDNTDGMLRLQIK